MPAGQEYLHVIAQLRTLQSSDRNPRRKVTKLLALALWFLKSHVGRYIRGHPDQVQDTLCMALDRADLEDR